jgi:hypothetical protein
MTMFMLYSSRHDAMRMPTNASIDIEKSRFLL